MVSILLVPPIALSFRLGGYRSGVGKTTLAGRLADLLSVPCHDLDQVLFTDSGPLPLEEFRSLTASLTQAGRRELFQLADVTWHRTDAVIWLDHRLPLIVSRVTRRNLHRLTGRESVPTGTFGWKRAFFSRKSGKSVLANAVRKYVRNRGKYTAQLSETAALGVQVFRFRTPRQAEEWLATVASRPAAGKARPPEATSSTKACQCPRPVHDETVYSIANPA